MEAHQVLSGDDQQEVIYLVVDENSQGQQVTQIVSDGQLLGHQAQIIMQDGKQAVLITEGNRQQVVLLEDDVAPEHVQTAIQQGAIQQDLIQQSTPSMVMSHTSAASTSAVNGGQVQYLVTENGDILTSMNQVNPAQPTITFTTQQQPPQLMVTQSGLVRVDSPRAKKDAGKSLINQAALQEAASKSPRAGHRPAEEVIIISESPDTKRIHIDPPSTKGTLREFINQAVDKQLSEMAGDQLAEIHEQVILAPAANVDIETEVITGEVSMEADSKDDTDTIGFGDDDKVELPQDIEPDSTQSADVMNGVLDEQIIETSIETVVSTVSESGMITVTTDMPPHSVLPYHVMAGDDEKSMDEAEQHIQVPQVINVPDQSVEIDTAQIFGETEVESTVSVSDVNNVTVVDDGMIVTSEDISTISSEVIQSSSQQNMDQTQPVIEQEIVHTAPQPSSEQHVQSPPSVRSPVHPSTLIVHQQEKKKAPLIPTTVITVISQPSTSRRKSHQKEKLDESESESQSDSHTSTSPKKSPIVSGESIASRRERRTSKPTRYYGLDVDYEVYPTDIYRSYRRGSESGDDTNAVRVKKDYTRIVDETHEFGRTKKIEDKVEIKRGRPRKSDAIKQQEQEDSLESDLQSADEEIGQQKPEVTESDKEDTVERRRGRPRKSDVTIKPAAELEPDDSQESDLHSADEEKLPGKQGTPKASESMKVPKRRGRAKKSDIMKQKEPEEELYDSEELDDLIIADDTSTAKAVISVSTPIKTDLNTVQQTTESQDSYVEDITPVEDEVVEEPVKRKRGRPPKKRSFSHVIEDKVKPKVKEITTVRRTPGRSPRPTTEVVVEAEIHRSPVEPTAHIDPEDLDLSVVPPIMDSSAMEVDDAQTIVHEDAALVETAELIDTGLVAEDVHVVEAAVDQMETVVDQNEEGINKPLTLENEDFTHEKEEIVKKTPKRERLSKGSNKPLKCSTQMDEESTTQDDSEEGSPRRSNRAKDDINYTENSEEDGEESSTRTKSIKPLSKTYEQLQAENESLYSLQKEVTDLKFVNDSLEMRLAHHSGSPEEIRSLQARIDRLQMCNSELEAKLKGLDKSQKIGINIKGMKFSVKKDNSTTQSAAKSTETSLVKLREIEFAEQELRIREKMLDKREKKAKAMDNELDERGSLLTKRESKLDRWERKLNSQEKELEYKEKQNRRFENDLRDLGGSGSARKKHGFTEDLELVVQKKELLEREEEIRQQEAAMLAKEKLLAATEQQLKALNAELNEKAVYLQAKGNSHSSEEEESVMDTDSQATSKGKLSVPKSPKEKAKGKMPRGRDSLTKSASSLLTKKLVTSRRTSSVSSQESAASSPKRTSKSSPKKLTKKMTSSPASAKRKGSQTDSDATPVSVKKVKATPKTSEKKTPSSKPTKTPERKGYSLKSPTAKVSETKPPSLEITPGAVKKSPLKSPKVDKNTLSVKSSTLKTKKHYPNLLKSHSAKTGKNTPNLKSPLTKSASKKSPSKVGKNTPILKSPMRAGKDTPPPESGKKTPSLKSPGVKTGKKVPALKTPTVKERSSTEKTTKSPMSKKDNNKKLSFEKAGKANTIKSPVYKSRKSDIRSQSPAVPGQKRKRMSDVKSPQPSKARRK